MVSSLVPSPSAGNTDLTFRDFRADRALGRSSLYQDIANAAATKYCALFKKSPATVARLIPFGPGLIDNSRGIFDDMCEPTDEPPAPAPPFSGGQCACVQYRVEWDYYFEGTFQRHDVYVVNGPVGALGFTDATGGIYGFTRGAPACPQNFFTIFSGNRQEIAAGRFQARSFTASPVTPGQDICGSLPPSYPPPTATPTDLQGTTIINVSPSVPVTVPVTIIPTFAPVTGIFRPEFNVDVGGINVNISAGGFTFSPTIQIEPNINVPFSDPRTTPPAALPIAPPSSSGGSQCDLTPVLTKVKEVKDELDRCCDRLSPYAEPLTSEYDIAVLGTGIAGTLNLPARTFRVTVQVVNRPQNEKIIYGNGSDDVLFCGWAWFNRGGGLSERLPIDAANKSYEPPSRSEGTFVYAMYAGYTATIRAYYAKSAVNP